MPRLCQVDPALPRLIAAQDDLVTRRQALRAGLTPRAIGYRLAKRHWRDVLPGVYLTHRGTPSRRQQLVASMLYAGPEAAIDGSDACQFHGIRAVSPDPAFVHIVVPWEHRARNVRYLHVRRTRAEIVTVETDLVRYVDPATAAMTVARGSYGARRAMAVLSDTLQRRLATYEELLQAHVRGTPRNARMLDEILASLASGVRSVPENDFRQLVQASRLLPTPLYNCLLRLPCGRLISPDALIQDAGLVHESNGRLAHAREDLFEDLQERHDVMTAAGLTVLHNPPRRLKTQGRIAIGEVERCYVRLAGNGMPPGVVIVRRSAD